MDAILLQILNGLDKGGAYALIALGLTVIFGTLGVVNFAHGALFMLGAFCAVTLKRLLQVSFVTESETQKDFLGNPLKIETPYVEHWFGDFGSLLIEYSVPASIIMAIPVMLFIGVTMERGLIRFFYKRPHAEQILVTFGLAIVVGEIIKKFFGANPIPQPAPDAARGMVDFGAAIGLNAGNVVYPAWRLIYFLFSLAVIGALITRLRETDEQASSMSFQRVKARTQGLLDRIAQEQEDGRRMTPSLTHQQIADMIGTSRETVTRVVKGLKEDGWLEQEGKKYVVPAEEVTPG